jgi:hypothetical protein
MSGRIRGVRRALTWLVALPVMVVGSQFAHGVAYWWAYPQASLRLSVLGQSGHGYLAYAPIVLGFLGAIETVVFASAVLNTVRGRVVRSLPTWVFLVIPAVGFTLQEHLERFLRAGTFPWWTVLVPSFWRGLVLQVPLGLVAYLIARLLLRTASAVATIVRTRRGVLPTVRPLPVRAGAARVVLLPRPTPLASAAAGRAPPLVAG